MQDAQQLYEFQQLHKRCDDLAAANNVLTDATSEMLLRIRAYENKINNSWILTRWLSQAKIVREMKRVDDMEGMINQTQADREERAKVQQQIIDSKAKRDKATKKRLDQQEKKVMREAKKHEKNGGKK